MQSPAGKVLHCPFVSSDIDSLKEEVLGKLEVAGFAMVRSEDDRPDLPIAFWFVALVFEASGIERSVWGNFASGVRVGLRDPPSSSTGAVCTETEVTTPQADR